jgi:hypothetical protein
MHAARAAASSVEDLPWPAGGRFVDAGSDTSGLASDIYASGLPPEVRPQVFLFQRVAAGGWQAELDFPAPVIQLHHYLAGDSNDAGDAFPGEAVPVRHTVALVLQPPKGDPTTVTVLADGSTVVAKAGAQIATSTSLFVGNRLIIAVPEAAAVGDAWTVQAVIRIAGDGPLRPVIGGRRGLPAELVYATQPAVVGVLTGNDAKGPEPLAATAIVNSTTPGVQSPDPVALPAGGRPTSLRLERRGKSLVAVVTTDAPPRAPGASTTVNGDPVEQETVHLSIAPEVQDALGASRIDVAYAYPISTCGQPKCPAGTVASVVIAGNYVGTVPVTVAGKELRFDLGRFAPSTQAPGTAPSIPPGTQYIGMTNDSFGLDAQDLDMVPLNATSPPWSGTTTITLDGTTISVTSPTGETAKGVVNPFTGYFFATDADEMWSGFLGKQGWYARIQASARKTAAVRGGVHADIAPGTPQNEIVEYYWNQKLSRGEQTLPLGLRPYLDAYRPRGGYQGQGSAQRPYQFDDAVKQWLFEFDVGNTIQFPFGFDPVVVPPPAALAFPFEKAFPDLARPNGQWEIAAGVQLASAHGNLVYALGPYVPASSLAG